MLDFARMHSDPGTQAKICDLVVEPQQRSDAPARRVEGCECAVAGRLPPLATAAVDGLAEQRVMALDQLAPAAVSYGRRLPRRVHQISEGNGRQKPVGLGR